LASGLIGAFKTVGVGRRQLTTVDRGVMEERVVASWRVRRRLQADHAAKLVLVLRGHLDDDRAAHRATHDHGPLEPEAEPHGADGFEVVVVVKKYFFSHHPSGGFDRP
jgi:hypothetical protein